MTLHFQNKNDITLKCFAGKLTEENNIANQKEKRDGKRKNHINSRKAITPGSQWCMDSELVEVEEGLRWTVKHFVEKKRFENLEEVLLWNTLIFVMNREVLYFQWKHKNDIKITSLLILPSQNNFSLVLSVFEFLKWFCLVNYMLSRKIIWFYMSTRDFNNLYLKYLSYFIYFIC